MNPHNEKINNDFVLDDFLNTNYIFDFLRSPPTDLSVLEEQEHETFSNKFGSSISDHLGRCTHPPRPSLYRHNSDTIYNGLVPDDYINTDHMGILHSPSPTAANFSFIKEQPCSLHPSSSSSHILDVNDPYFLDVLDAWYSDQLGTFTPQVIAETRNQSMMPHNDKIDNEHISDFLHSPPVDMSFIEEQTSICKQNPPSSNCSESPPSISDQRGPSTNPPRRSFCINCMVLREIIHTNGTDTTKLEIHDSMGLLSHALQQNNTHSNEYKLFDFCQKEMEEVKNFLVQYCKDKKQRGYALLPDPLSIFHESLSIGLEGVPNLNTYDFSQPPKRIYNNRGNQMDHQTEQDSQTRKALKNEIYDFSQPPKRTRNNEEGNKPKQDNQPGKALKISLSEQRKRVANMTFRDVEEYFHLPVKEASKKLKICESVLQSRCRKYGFKRWPYRKIRCIEKKIANLQPKLYSDDAEIRENAQNNIEKFQRQKANACTPSQGCV